MGLDATLRRDLFEPTSTTTVDQYRELLAEKEEVWMEIYGQRSTNPRTQSSAPQSRSYTPNPRLLSPVRSLTNRPQLQGSTPQTAPSQTAQQQPYQVNSPPNARLPCPFHAARGQTYYHSPLACKLPEAKALLSNETSTRIQQINFQAQSETRDSLTSDASTYEDIPQYVDYDPDDDQEGDVPYDSARDFYAPFGSDIMHNLIDHPSVVNPSPYNTPAVASDSPLYVPIHKCSTCTAEFFSKNRLFKHLREYQHFQKSQPDDSTMFHSTIDTDVIKSTSVPVSGAGLSFRSYNFTEIQVNFSPASDPLWVCLDSGCGMSCICNVLTISSKYG
jgi:hypothetical protein